MSWTRSFVLLTALTAGLGSGRIAQASLMTAYGVDSALGGPMAITGYTNDNPRQQITITAKNQSSSTIHDVHLVVEFLFPSEGAEPYLQPTGDALAYLGSGKWQNSTTPDTVTLMGVNGPYSFNLEALSSSDFDVPFSDDVGGYTTGALNTTDIVPVIGLLDFAPGQSKTFVLSAAPTGPFNYVGDAFFVAASGASPVPEPSTLLLLAFGGGIGALARRRWQQAG